MRQLVILATIFAALFSSCRPEIYYPKPTGYFRVDTPGTHKYVVFNRDGFPYSFEYPEGALVSNDTMFSNEQESKYWINIYIPQLEGIINITYKEITPTQTILKLMDDAWGLSYFHHEKADYINTESEVNDQGVTYTVYTVGGNTASRYQFAATDSTHHFVRGALYFDVTPNVDSLKPITDFLLTDIQHMLKTMKLKEAK